MLFKKRGVDEAMQALIGNIVLNGELRRANECDRDEEVSRGWAEVHWRPPHARTTTAVGVDGRHAADDDGRDGQRPEERDERARAGTRAQGGAQRDVRTAAESGESHARQRHATTTATNAS